MEFDPLTEETWGNINTPNPRKFKLRGMLAIPTGAQRW